MSSGQHQIIYCNSCERYSLVYNNCTANFSMEEMRRFYDMLDTLEDRHFCLEVGIKNMVLIKDPKINIGMCLSREDVVEIKQAINESILLLEAIQILQS